MWTLACTALIAGFALRRWPWQSLVAFVALLVIWAVAQTAVSGVHDAHAALAFGALIAFGELLRLNLPGDREAAPVATAGALAYALLLRIGNAPARPEAARATAATSCRAGTGTCRTVIHGTGA